MHNILNVTNTSDYFNLRKYEVLHPMIGILDYSKIDKEHYSNDGFDALHFGCYAVFLKDSKGCKMKYGGKPYDYDEGTMVFVGPGQTIELTTSDQDYVPKGYVLLFHPDLLLGTELAKKIHGYSFFSYLVKEALHLSTKERHIILSLLDKIQFELEQNLDQHSKKLIVSNIELLLDYCLRFYDRQFLTRENVHQDRFTILTGC